MPNEREGCLNKLEDQKKLQNLINGGFKINRRGLEFENRLTITLERRKEQYQVVMKNKLNYIQKQAILL